MESNALWVVADLRTVLTGLSCGELLLIEVHLFELCLSMVAWLIIAWMNWMSIDGIAASMSGAGLGVVLMAPIMARLALLSSLRIFFNSLVVSIH